MQLSRNLDEYLVSELRTVAIKMRQDEQNARTALFWYSAAYGAALRALNIEYQRELVLLHLVLNSTHSEINARLHAQDQVVSVPADLFGNLADLVETLANRIQANESYVDVLESIAALSYTTTGNGFYLSQTGRTPTS